MRKLLIACCMLAATVAVAEEEENNNFANMGRGIVNIATCPAEVPHFMVYRNSEVPLWGLVGGAVEGGGMTCIRALSGVTDLAFLGFDLGLWFNKTTFCDYVWDSEWIPRDR